MSKLDAAYMANEWTTAYHSEAQKCTDEWGNTCIGMHPNTMNSMLAVAFDKIQSNPNYNLISSGDIDAAINAYWSGVILTTSNVPPDGIVGITNVLTGTGSTYALDESLKTVASDGANDICGQSPYAGGLKAKTTSIPTLFAYIQQGTPPTPTTKSSTLR